MRSITGQVTILGISREGPFDVTYFLIGMGMRVLRSKSLPRVLDHFVRQALIQDGQTTLWYSGRQIYGVQMPCGQIYYCRTPRMYGLFQIQLEGPGTGSFEAGRFLIYLSAAPLRIAIGCMLLRGRGGINLKAF